MLIDGWDGYLIYGLVGWLVTSRHLCLRGGCLSLIVALLIFGFWLFFILIVIAHVRKVSLFFELKSAQVAICILFLHCEYQLKREDKYAVSRWEEPLPKKFSESAKMLRCIGGSLLAWDLITGIYTYRRITYVCAALGKAVH